MAKDYSQLAKDIVALVGGEENVDSLIHCITRLRFHLKDEGKAQTDKIKQLSGVMGVVVSNGQYQVVIGPHVGDVYQAIGTYTGVGLDGEASGANAGEGGTDEKKKGIGDMLVDLISAVFLPCMTGMAGAGLLKAVLIMLTNLSLLSTESTTYTILYAAADAFFYFMPIILAANAAKKFKANVTIAMCMAAAFVYPSITGLVGAEHVTFIGIPVKMISYSSSALPALVAVYVQSKLERLLNKVIPKLVSSIFVPMLTLIVMVPLSFLVIGPVTSTAGNILAAAYTSLYTFCPPLTGFVFAALWPTLIIFGLHWGFFPVVMNNFSVYGFDTCMALTSGCNFSQAGACLGILLKSKNAEIKQLASSCFISALLGGVTEPAIYGLTLKYKRPFVIASLCSGIGGIFIAMAGTQFTALPTTCLLTLPALMSFYGGFAILIAAVIGFFGTAVLTFLFGYNDSMLQA